MTRVYAIGDVHGHLDQLHEALARITADRRATGDPSAPVVQIGDLVDRGPDSQGVVRFLMSETARDPRLTVLRGNHDNMLALFLGDSPARDPRLRPQFDYLHPRIGGRQALASWGVDPDLPEDQLHRQARAAVSAAERDFLATLPLSCAFGDCLFVHAGIRPGVPLDRQDPSDLYWIRDEFLLDSRDHGPLVVHGHTPVDRVEHHGNRLAIDTGAAYDGPLSTVVIEGRRAFLLTPSGRQEISPHAAA